MVKSMLNVKLGIISPKFRGTRYKIRKKDATYPPKINMSPKWDHLTRKFHRPTIKFWGICSFQVGNLCLVLFHWQFSSFNLFSWKIWPPHRRREKTDLWKPDSSGTGLDPTYGAHIPFVGTLKNPEKLEDERNKTDPYDRLVKMKASLFHGLLWSLKNWLLQSNNQSLGWLLRWVLPSFCRRTSLFYFYRC